jgi:hypothetical protein
MVESTPNNPEEDQWEYRLRYRPMGDPVSPEELAKLVEDKKATWDETKYFLTVKEDESFYDKHGYYFDHNGIDSFGGYYESFPYETEDGKQEEDHYYVPNEDFEEEYKETEDNQDFDMWLPELKLTEEGSEQFEEHLYSRKFSPTSDPFRPCYPGPGLPEDQEGGKEERHGGAQHP